MVKFNVRCKVKDRKGGREGRTKEGRMNKKKSWESEEKIVPIQERAKLRGEAGGYPQATTRKS